MADAPAVLFVSDDAFHLAAPGGAVVELAPTAAAVRAAMEADGNKRRRVVLAVPSRWCMCAGISIDGLPKRNRRAAMLYRLEEALPVAAEDVLADFAVTANGKALGVAVLREQIAPLVEALEGEGIAVEHVGPTALLATQADPPRDADAVVWQDGQDADVVLLHEGNPTGWFTTSADADWLALHLRLARGDGAGNIRLATRGLTASLASVPDVEVTDASALSMRDAAIAGARLIAAGRAAPWIDMRRGGGEFGAARAPGQLGRPLTATLLAACLFLAVCSAAMVWRAARYWAFADDLRDRQAAAFAEAFPGARVPLAANIGRRLEIEARRLDSGRDEVGEAAPSALSLLGQTLARLPADVRFRLFELRVGPDELYLDGEARTHGDADAIAAALRGIGGFDIGPPGTQQVGPRAVTFRINGVPVRSLANAGEQR